MREEFTALLMIPSDFVNLAKSLNEYRHDRHPKPDELLKDSPTSALDVYQAIAHRPAQLRGGEKLDRLHERG